jgi:glycosyltransferase involved in cell wall biosynthesis
MIFAAGVIVVVPAWNEAPRIARVLRGMPADVDRIVLVDDASTDGTIDAARAVGDRRVEIVSHPHNRGVGGAIVTGYRRAMELGGGPRDAFVVMACYGQMAPADLPALVLPIAMGEADYVKGERFSWPGASDVIPEQRLVGGLVFSWLSSQAMGRRIHDSQCGYTALSRAACARLNLERIWPSYGYPNDVLGQLARRGLRIAERPVRPIYAGEVSRMKPHHVVLVAWVIARVWLRRKQAQWHEGSRTRTA